MPAADILTLVAAVLIVATVTLHSVLGERRLIGPMLAMRGGVLDHDLARGVIRFAWHFTSAIGVIVAASLVAAVLRPVALRDILMLTAGITFSAAGLIDGIITRWRHVGWPFVTAAGIACIGAYVFT